jgi:hypothetical protein
MNHKILGMFAVSVCAAALLGLPMREASAQERSLGTGSETTKEAGDVTKGYPGRLRETAIGATPTRPTEESETRSLPQGPDPADASLPNARNSYPRNSPQR